MRYLLWNLLVYTFLTAVMGVTFIALISVAKW